MQQNYMNILNHKCVFSTSLHENIASFFQYVWLKDIMEIKCFDIVIKVLQENKSKKKLVKNI